MQRLIFEYSPWFILLSVLAGFTYAFILYRKKNTWGPAMNRVLFTLRMILVSFVAFLLIGPIVKLTLHTQDRPSLVFLLDNSMSIKESVDSITRKALTDRIAQSKKKFEDSGFEVSVRDLNNLPVEKIKFDAPSSDINGALRQLMSHYEGKNLAQVILVSDGIYNSGVSPLYAKSRVPINTIGIGDTIQRPDIAIKNLLYNKIAYQGNQFPVKAEVSVRDLRENEITAVLRRSGKEIGRVTQKAKSNSLLQFDFKVEASEKGMQRLDIYIEPDKEESNKKNNTATAFVEVVEGKKRILMIAPSPHPDIKALRSVIEKNPNYELVVHVPGISNTDPALLDPSKSELVIFNEAFDNEGKTLPLITRFAKSNSSMLLIISERTNIRQLAANGIPIVFESFGQRDEISPILNQSFLNFSFPENSGGAISKYPPVDVPFGRFSFPPGSSVLLNQRIGNVSTERPLLLSWEKGDQKMAVLLGNNIWKWRLSEFAASEKTEFFDDITSKLIQYLSTRVTKSKFRCFSLQQEYSESEAVTFEAQVYNDLFELVYGNTIEIELRGEDGKSSKYNYSTSSGNSRYRVGNLKEGVYTYRASTSVNGKSEEVRGQFLVRGLNKEVQNLTADFALLRKMAQSSDGKFYNISSWDDLDRDVIAQDIPTVIHSDESFNPLINLKWVFFWLLFVISLEWFLRKYLGGY